MLLMVCISMFFYAAALALANGTRLHSEKLLINVEYFFPFLVWLFSVLLIQRGISRKLPNRDPWIFPTVAALSGLGMLTIWRLSPELGFKQALWFLFGTFSFLFALQAKDLIIGLKKFKYVWLLAGLILIGLTFVIGVNPNGIGQRLWLKVVNFYIQPSEPLKLLLIIYLAGFFADQIRPNSSWVSSVFPTLVVISLAGLLLIAQRDLGTASLFVMLYVLMLSVTTQKRKLLWIIPVLALIAGVIGYFAFDVVKSRVDIWINPWLDTSGSSWQLAQAQIAIAAGGLTGTGPGLGSPQFVPVAVSDFIFTSIAEEMGLSGTLAVTLLLLLIVMRGIKTALSSKTTFGRYLAFGISSWFGLQSIMIIGGNMGLLPLTGVTLPFLSYGGSSLVTNLMAIMLLLKISTETASKGLVDKSRSPYKLVATIFCIFFIVIAVWNGYLAFPKQRELLSRAENPRWAVYDRFSPRGEIYALSGEKLVEVLGSPGSYQLRISYPELSNTLGFADPVYGQSGLQASQYDLLRGYAGTSAEENWKNQLLYNQPLPGLDIKLNLNLSLQKKADELLGDHNGAIVLMNAQTGEIYAMASHPYFDANQIAENWDSLMARTDAPLLNRATQGTYPLGTLANLLAMNSLLESNHIFDLSSPDSLAKLDPYCYAAMQASGTSLNAYQFGCESISNDILQAVDPALLLDDLEKLGLFEAPNLAVQTAKADQPLTEEELDANPLLVSNIHVSPLQMSLVAATITNNGFRPSPALVNAYKTPEGEWLLYGQNRPSQQVFEKSKVGAIQASFTSEQNPIWYQLGHALINDSDPLTWYIGGTTADWIATPLVIAIAIEENNPALAMNIGQTLLTLISTD